MDEAAEPVACEHSWCSYHEPGHRLYWVRTCVLCGAPDWDDLDRQILEVLNGIQPTMNL